MISSRDHFNLRPRAQAACLAIGLHSGDITLRELAQLRRGSGVLHEAPGLLERGLFPVLLEEGGGALVLGAQTAAISA